MNRRELIPLLGGAAAAWPLAARAQQPTRLPTIGFLGPSGTSLAVDWIAAFVHRLGELGWVDGRTVRIEYRWADGKTERFTELALEFARLKVDVIATWGTATTIAAHGAAPEIPIVFAVASDPVATGLAASLARPGGMITGLSVQANELAGKRLELLRELAPRLRRVAILTNVENPASVLETGEIQTAAPLLGLNTVPLEIHRAEDIGPAFESIKDAADALYMTADPLLGTSRVRINTLALGARLPTMCTLREFVEAGCLLSYGPNYPALFRRTADFVDKILRGTKSADIPVEQPTKFDLVINATTAKALGLTLPPMVLARADEVIE